MRRTLLVAEHKSSARLRRHQIERHDGGGSGRDDEWAPWLVCRILREQLCRVQHLAVVDTHNVLCADIHIEHLAKCENRPITSNRRNLGISWDLLKKYASALTATNRIVSISREESQNRTHGDGDGPVSHRADHPRQLQVHHKQLSLWVEGRDLRPHRTRGLQCTTAIWQLRL